MAVTEADFAAGAPLHELGLQLQLWASFRWVSGGRGGEVCQGTIRLVVTCIAPNNAGVSFSPALCAA